MRLRMGVDTGSTFTDCFVCEGYLRLSVPYLEEGAGGTERQTRLRA